MSYLSVAGVRNGSVVVVKVNPAASTAFLDPELDQEAGKIQTGKYLALLSGIVRKIYSFFFFARQETKVPCRVSTKMETH